MSEKPKTTICSYCSIGCALDVHEVGGKTRIRGQAEYPVNEGRACDKGLNLIEPHDSSERGTIPLVKTETGMEPLQWTDAAWLFSNRMKDILR